MKKKITIKEFNQKYFEGWREIDKIVPIFEEWGDEEGENKERHITQIEIWFKEGNRIKLVPYSNKDEQDEEICTAIDIREFIGKSIEWKEEK